MKDTKVEKNRNITMWIGLAMAAVMIGGGVATDYAQNSPARARVGRKIQSGSGRRRMGRRLGPRPGFDWEIRGRRHLLRGAARIRGMVKFSHYSR